MSIKKLVKTIGRGFIAFKQTDERFLRQSVLIVDDGNCQFEQVVAVVEKIRSYLPKAEISILTLPWRKGDLQGFLPQMEYVFPSLGLRPARYRLALQMLKMRKKGYAYVVVCSLAVTPVLAAILFMDAKLILYNQWRQWWQLRLRGVSEIFKKTYAKRAEGSVFKNLLSGLSRFFFLLQRDDENIFRVSILLVDDNLTPYRQINYTIEKIKEYLPYSVISVLTLKQEKCLENKFPGLKIIVPAGCFIKSYRLARQMVRTAKDNYDFIMLLSLDITPVIAAALFMQGRIVLYNKWGQWWLLRLKSIIDYLGGFLSYIFNFILSIFVFFYLIVNISLILFKRLLNFSYLD